MKVCELIALLQQQNPEADVIMEDAWMAAALTGSSSYGVDLRSERARV